MHIDSIHAVSGTPKLKVSTFIPSIVENHKKLFPALRTSVSSSAGPEEAKRALERREATRQTMLDANICWAKPIL